VKMILARLVDQSGKLLLPPSPSFQLIDDGKPIRNYTLDQIEDLALKQVISESQPKMQER
jgi:hypothetical protein